jgi:hypothetical protein
MKRNIKKSKYLLNKEGKKYRANNLLSLVIKVLLGKAEVNGK